MKRYTVLVMRGLVHLLGTIRRRTEIFVEPKLNHNLFTDLTAVFFVSLSDVVPIAGSRFLVRHFKRINTEVVVWLGREDASTLQLARIAPYIFFQRLVFWIFQLFCCYTSF